ncbi:MAG: hypothetical protein ACLFUU_13230, partial [Desulfobacteraceae bacterium]
RFLCLYRFLSSNLQEPPRSDKGFDMRIFSAIFPGEVITIGDGKLASLSAPEKKAGLKLTLPFSYRRRLDR